VAHVDDVDQLVAKQILDSGLDRRLGSHRSASRNLQGFETITAKSCNQRHPLSSRKPLGEPIFGLFRADHRGFPARVALDPLLVADPDAPRMLIPGIA